MLVASLAQHGVWHYASTSKQAMLRIMIQRNVDVYLLFLSSFVLELSNTFENLGQSPQCYHFIIPMLFYHDINQESPWNVFKCLHLHPKFCFGLIVYFFFLIYEYSQKMSFLLRYLEESNLDKVDKVAMISNQSFNHLLFSLEFLLLLLTWALFVWKFFKLKAFHL